jgi:hypothetical protein
MSSENPTSFEVLGRKRILWLFAASGGLTLVFVWMLLSQANAATDTESRVVYPKRTELDFDGLQIEGEVRNPGEFYFRRRPEEKFDSLVKRRTQFHREMLRDVVLSK